MNPEEDKIFFLCLAALRILWQQFFIVSDSRMEVSRHRRIDINGFNVVLEKFSFDLKVS